MWVGESLQSHVAVVWTAAAFWHDPVDVLAWVLDVASLAMNAVLGIDYEPWVGSVEVTRHLIHARWTIILLWRAVASEIDGSPDRRVAYHEVAGLVFYMVRVGDKH